jgi:hypothetical protein
MPNDIDDIDKAQKDFFDNHMQRKEVFELLKVGNKNVGTLIFNNRITKVKIPDGYPIPYHSVNYMYSKKQVYEIKRNNDFILANCITQKQAIEYLDLSTTDARKNYSENFVKIVEEFNLKSYKMIGFGNTKNIVKNEIEVIKAKQKEFWEKHIGSFEIKKIHSTACSNTHKYFGGLETFEIPIYAKIKAVCYGGGGQLAYKRDEVLNRLEPFIKKKQIFNISGETYFDTFKLRLDMIADELIKFKSSAYTKEKWLKFVESKLKPTQSLKTAESNIGQFMLATTDIINKALEEFNISEIYSLSPKELALAYNWANVGQKIQLYDFFVKVEEDVRLQLRKSKSHIKGFGLDEVNKIRNKENNNSEKKRSENSERNNEIYDFDIYAKAFKFLSDIKLHTKNSIDKILREKDIRYSSLWLYLMLHLNNAWRHGDTADFPRLHVYDLLSEFEITGIEWFRDNELTLEQSRRLIQRVINQEFRISKTQIKGHFFSSDVLAPAIATAILIIEAFLVSKDVFDSETEYVPLLNFKTKYNQPTDSQLQNFFKGMDDYEGFVFKSRKMNKSVMTFIYHLSNMAGDDNALKLVQQLRNHMDATSPLHYVDFNLEKIETLTKQLFKRGEFGYIPSLLVQKIQGKLLSFEEMTEQVYRVNTTFNGIFKVQSTIGFLNTVNHERAMVMRMIEESSLEECEAFLTDIFTGNLPSREEDIQCLTSKQGCQRPDLKTCLGCQYHIPSIYALTTICRAILNDIKMYKATKSLARQMKIALSFDRKIMVLKEATHQFGEEYVYSCIGLSEEELLEEIELIPEPSEFYEQLLSEK